MKNIFYIIRNHANSHAHAARRAIHAYMEARNYYMKNHAKRLSDGTLETAFAHGPVGELP